MGARTRMQIIDDAVRACAAMIPLPPPTETDVDPDDDSIVHRWVSGCGKETFSLTFTGNGMVTGYFSSPFSTKPAWRVSVDDASLKDAFPASLRHGYVPTAEIVSLVDWRETRNSKAALVRWALRLKKQLEANMAAQAGDPTAIRQQEKP